VRDSRTQPMSAALLMDELSLFCQTAAPDDAVMATVMFGWDSNLEMDDMWQDMLVPVRELASFVRAAEVAGTVSVGKSDIIVSVGKANMTLCHESDLHIEGPDEVTGPIVQRWQEQAYSPYLVLSSSSQRAAGSRGG